MKVNVFPGVREQLKNQYIKRIVSGELQPGSRIDAVREIAEKSGVSHVTASSMLKELVKDGWVVSYVGRGSFVVDNPPVELYCEAHDSRDGRSQLYTNGKTNIYFIHCFSEANTSSSYHYQILTAIQHELKERTWNVIPYVWTEGDKMEKIRDDKQALGVVMSNPYANSKKYIYDALDRFNLPVIQYGMHPELLQCNYVMPDNYTMGVLAGEYLLSKNHVNIQFVTAWTAAENWGVFFNQHHFKLRNDGLEEVLKRAGIESRPVMRWHIEMAECRKAMSDLLGWVGRSEPGCPTVLVVANQAMAAELLYLAEMMQVNVPDDLSIISFERRALKDQDESFITTIDFNKQTMGRMIIQQLEYILKSPQDAPLKNILPVKLFEGGSVKAL